MISGSGRRAAARLGRMLVVGGLVVGLGASACSMPQSRSEPREVDDGSDSAKAEGQVPVFPAEGEVPAELLVAGLTYDLSTRPRDQNYWTPSTAEARCTAEGIVAGIGAPRLSQLGYRVDTPGASINDVALSDAERTVVIDSFSSCVDMVEGVASLLFGDGRLPNRAAICVAEGLGRDDMLRPFVEAWAFGRAVDPFAADAAFGTALLDEANVCISGAAFDWPDVRLPDDDPLIDSDAAGGTSRSPYVDDRRPTGDSPAPTVATAPPATPAG
jgi:hypothetical protein